MSDDKQVVKQNILLHVRKGEGIVKSSDSDVCESYSDDRWTCCIIGKCYDIAYNSVSAEMLCRELEQYGKINLMNYQGMFALVYYNEMQVCFTVDSIGMYRLYYYFSNDELVIADHTEDIVDLVYEDFHIDYQAWSEFFHFSYVLGNRTFFKEIRSVYPEDLMVCDIKAWKLYSHILKGYSTIEENTSLTFDEAVEQSVSLLNTAVAQILGGGQKNKRILCPLSGGYDSRCLAGLLRKQNIDCVETYTADFDEGSQADEVYGGIVAEFLHYSNKLIRLEDKYFEKEIEQYLYDTNFESVENIPFWNYSKLLDVMNAMLLDGYAGDRLLRTRICRSDYNGEEAFLDAFFVKNGNQNIKKLCDSKNLAYIQYLAKKGMKEEWNRCKGNIVIYYLFNRNHRNIAYNPAHMDCSSDVYTPFTNPEFLKFALTIPESIKSDSHFYCSVLNKIIDGLGDLPSTNDVDGWRTAMMQPIKLNSQNYRDMMKDDLTDYVEETGDVYYLNQTLDVIDSLSDTGERLSKTILPMWFYKKWRVEYKNRLDSCLLEEYFMADNNNLTLINQPITTIVSNEERSRLTSIWLDYIMREKKTDNHMKMCYTMDVEGFISGPLYSHGIYGDNAQKAVEQLYYGGEIDKTYIRKLFRRQELVLERIAHSKDFCCTFFVEVFSDVWKDRYEQRLSLLKLCNSNANEVGLHCHLFGLSREFLQNINLLPNEYKTREGFAKILRHGIEIYKKALDVSPVSYRSGNFEIFPEYFGGLADAGISVDASLYYKNKYLPDCRIKNENCMIDGIFEIPVTSFYNIEKNREQRFDLNSTTYAQKLECIARNVVAGTPSMVMLSHSWSFSDYYMLSGEYGELKKKYHNRFSQNTYDELMYLTEFIHKSGMIDFSTCKELYKNSIAMEEEKAIATRGVNQIHLVDVCGVPESRPVYESAPSYGKLRHLSEEGFINLSDALLESNIDGVTFYRMVKDRMELVLPEKKQPHKGDFAKAIYTVAVEKGKAYQVSLLLDNPYYKEKFRGRNRIRYTVQVADKEVFSNFITEPDRDEVVTYNWIASANYDKDVIKIEVMIECIEDEEPWGWGSAAKLYIGGIHVQEGT